MSDERINFSVTADLGFLDANPSWMPGPANGFDRFERIAAEAAAAQGDFLDRIDAAIEAWEHGPDAYREEWPS
jgi:hypothetical protein